MIKIFDSTDTSFNTNGNIVINPLKLTETKKKSLNGWYINVEIPIEYKEYIQQDKLCVVKTKSKLNPQAFRIGDIQYTQRKIIFTANHVVFDAKNYFLVDVRPTELNALNSLKYINERTDNPSPFNIVSSDIELLDTCYFIRKNLLEAWTTIEERYNGIFDADNFDISFNSTIGIDRGEIIVYKKNLQNIKTFEDWSNVCTRIYPIGKDGLMLDSKFIDSEVQYDQPYTKTVDFETELEEENQTEDNLLNELEEKAKNYLLQNQQPLVSYEVSSDINQLLEIGDKIHVKHPIVNILTEVLEYEFDGISKRIKKIVFGNYTRDVKAKFDNIKSSIENVKIELSNQNKIINEQTEMINSLNKNGYVYIDDNEILILDALPKEDAKNVWRWGLGGLGFSSTGYKGPFGIAITSDGKINADFISTGTLSASRIEGYNNLLLTVDKIINLEKEITEQNYIYIPDAMKGQILNLTINGPFGLDFPSDDLYPSNNLYPLGSYLIIDTTRELSDNAKKIRLPVTYLADEEKFVIENGKSRIEHIDGTIEELEDVDIQLFEGKNYVYLESFENNDINLYAKYVIKNSYTDTFATKAEMNSSIKLSENNIKLEVAKKVNEDEVVSAINLSPDMINLKSNRLKIDSTYFKLSEDGRIESTAGKIGGYNLESDKFTAAIERKLGFSLKNQEEFNTITTKIINYIDGTGTLTEEEVKLYDLNFDGTVDKNDLLMIQSIYFGFLKIKGTFEINSTDGTKTLNFISEDGTEAGYIGLNGIKFYSVTAENASITGNLTTKNLTVNGTFNNLSDKRLKHNVKELSNNYTKIIEQLNPVSFVYNQNNTEHIGFIAQDMEKVFQKNHMEAIPIKIDDFGLYSINYIDLIGILWKDNQYLHQEIDCLKEMIKNGKNNI